MGRRVFLLNNSRGGTALKQRARVKFLSCKNDFGGMIWQVMFGMDK